MRRLFWARKICLNSFISRWSRSSLAIFFCHNQLINRCPNVTRELLLHQLVKEFQHTFLAQNNRRISMFKPLEKWKNSKTFSFISPILLNQLVKSTLFCRIKVLLKSWMAWKVLLSEKRN